MPVIRAHAGRRHARPARAVARKPFRQIVTDAAFRSTSIAVIAGVAYWSALQWVDVFSPPHAPRTIVTDTHYITLPE